MLMLLGARHAVCHDAAAAALRERICYAAFMPPIRDVRYERDAQVALKACRAEYRCLYGSEVAAAPLLLMVLFC